ncbi:transcriptional regulator [Streptomyces albireticuli]|uniref:Transcriptional regulator n=1 Tax=Streptomyces albireticuli TaxID=1940 RepID=A0A2A2DAM6_9ACTN|nr:transcriptional regulator [Streptomyces albireticuli]MCD9141604.1 tetratricopeptide repeat protein [Streptomyces albireticuli]MCD9164145.1 tetratricopeptide repeat protein [Streptomyces albireticuli]MCD9189778.1 tetratricopeptide repeat protein [Streptomyces albireticuli]PAU49543.1 transcriptional regulator [Streptomyces albireticuli]
MASSQAHHPNTAFRQLRGARSPGEFAAAVRRAAREIGEQVSCDARYIGRVESGEIRCPNYAYERVFRHMFPGREPADMGFVPRDVVRGRGARENADASPAGPSGGPAGGTADGTAGGSAHSPDRHKESKESDVLRRAFMTGGTAAVATASLGASLGASFGTAWAAPAPPAARDRRRAGEAEAVAVEQAVRRIRLLDDRHGADGIYRRAARPLRVAYELLDADTRRQSVADRLYTGAGELSLSVGWLAHDSGRFSDARSHYAEALATARVAGDAALEAHAFCNTAFLARDAGRPRESVRAAQAAQRAARRLPSPRLMSLLTLREAGGWAGLGDRVACEAALLRARDLFERGPGPADPEWMSFFGPAELEGLEAQCWSALGEWARAAEHARRAVDLQDPHFARNTALFTTQLAGDLARGGAPDAAAVEGGRALDLLEDVRSTRVRTMLAATARLLRRHRADPVVASFLERHEGAAVAV